MEEVPLETPVELSLQIADDWDPSTKYPASGSLGRAKGLTYVSKSLSSYLEVVQKYCKRLGGILSVQMLGLCPASVA